MSGVLVLITGTGRSGTSTMSGTLHYLGLSVPGPHLGANASNPKGFFESSWAMKFHDRLTKRAGIHVFDSRPSAFARVQEAITPEARENLERFLAAHAADSDQIVVKDPRSVWVQGLWREAATKVGLEIRYLAMLRHPAETVGSRTTYYAGPDADMQLRYSIFNVARWVNNSIINERETRGFPRAFVRYTDLLTDWRPVAAQLRDDFGLRYNTDLARGEHHEVDDFIDPDLRRHAVTWDELEVPKDLQDIAQEIWETLDVLASKGGVDEAASAGMDALSERFDRVLADADAVNYDAGLEAVSRARNEGAAQARAELEVARSTAGVEERPVGEVGGKDLLKVIAKRAKRKLPGSPARG